MLSDEIRVVLKERQNTDNNWSEGLELCWNRETELLARDIPQTIAFLESCSAEEFLLISEVFDDVTERVKSRELIDCLYRVSAKFPEETKKYNIIYCIQSAEELLGE